MRVKLGFKLHEYRTVQEASEHLAANFLFYNEERWHETRGYRTPKEVYFGKEATFVPVTEAMVLTRSESR